MDINEIKKLIKEDKAKIVITDEKGPAIIILDYAEYKALRDNRSLKPEKIIVPQIHREDPKEQAIPRELEDEPLKIEDLPF
jgi:PHD/YefM family antitoxin component YafN of YafNO toxin-antitoxin module